MKSPSAKHERQDCDQEEAQNTKEDLLVASQSTPLLTAEANDRATLEEMKFVKKCSTIRTLFDDLKIPMRDRKFFTKTFMATYNDTNVNFINEQLNLLQSHRARETASAFHFDLGRGGAKILINGEVVADTREGAPDFEIVQPEIEVIRIYSIE